MVDRSDKNGDVLFRYVKLPDGNFHFVRGVSHSLCSYDFLSELNLHD